ncbi:MAG: large subunit ribosomal protein [Bacteroidota bacterium]|jgi:large subunit ribosomal protein L13|nr:large subunit ribosomal protein [Bacteroidota bacterium]
MENDTKKPTNHLVIDATEQAIGRVASVAAKELMGKNTTAYEKNILPEINVTISNASKMKISDKKLTEKLYERYSGYPGGLKFKNLGDVIAKKGYEEVLRLAVYGMLPANKLRPRIMKYLTVND